MKFSKVIFIALAFISSYTFSQSVSMMGGAPEGVLFRGFANVIQVDDNLALNRIFNVEFIGGEIQTVQANDGTVSKGRYILTPGTGKIQPEIIIRDGEGVEMTRMSYKVSRMPDSDIAFATPNGLFQEGTSKLSVRNEAYPFFEKLYEIQKWSVFVNGETIAEGYGNDLDEETMMKITNLPAGTPFAVMTELMDNNGIIRKKTLNTYR